MENSVDPDETPRSVASHLGLNCLLRPVCPNTYGKYGISSLSNLEHVYFLIYPKDNFLHVPTHMSRTTICVTDVYECKCTYHEPTANILLSGLNWQNDNGRLSPI